MASCHSLAYSENELIGDPIDIIMFESVKWVLKEGKHPQIEEVAKGTVCPVAEQSLESKHNEVIIMKRNEFQSKL